MSCPLTQLADPSLRCALMIAKLLVKAKLLAKKDVGFDVYYSDVRVWLSEIQYGGA